MSVRVGKGGDGGGEGGGNDAMMRCDDAGRSIETDVDSRDLDGGNQLIMYCCGPTEDK